MACMKIFWTLAWSALLLMAINGHPQCLDFRPPFENEESLSFCGNYTDFGCCTASDDASLLQEYLVAQQRTTSSSEWARCQSYVQELLCQQCSPYAAHIFDAERTMRARTFPGLCTSYCLDFFQACSSLIPVIDPSLAGSRLLLHGETFCLHVGLTDVDYCYPELLQSPQLNTELQQRREQETSEGCLCLEPVGNKLAAPLLAKDAGDGSGRLFVGEQPGVVRILFPKEKAMLPVPFLNITARVETSNWYGDERGFLGLAFHRGFAENGRFFVYYSTPLQDDDGLTELEEAMGMDNLDHKIRISEMRVSQDNPNVADVNYEKILLEINQPYANHNGGEVSHLSSYLQAQNSSGSRKYKTSMNQLKKIFSELPPTPTKRRSEKHTC